jgi:hypothetical protein
VEDDSRLVCECGKPYVEMIEESFETFVEGYVVCSKCGRRIDVEGEFAEVLGAALGQLQDGWKKIADHMRPDPSKGECNCGGDGDHHS